MAEENERQAAAEAAVQNALDACGGEAQLMLALRNMAQRKRDYGRVEFYESAFRALGPEGQQVTEEFMRKAREVKDWSQKRNRDRS